MNLNDLRYLVALADHGSFRGAAKACYVSQPTLSAQVAKLERELGVPLVERARAGVFVTPAGHEIVAQARRCLMAADDLVATAHRAVDKEAGPLSLGAFPTLGPYLLPHVVGALRDRFPRVQWRLVEAKSAELAGALSSGALDAAVLATPAPVDGLASAELFVEEFVLAVPRDHALADTGPVAMDAIADEPILLLDEGHCLREHALSVCSLAGAKERDDFRATSLETLRQMVAAGQGVTLLPELACESPLSSELALVRFAPPAPSRILALHWRATHPGAPLLLHVAAALRAVDLPVTR